MNDYVLSIKRKLGKVNRRCKVILNRCRVCGCPLDPEEKYCDGDRCMTVTMDTEGREGKEDDIQQQNRCTG